MNVDLLEIKTIIIIVQLNKHCMVIEIEKYYNVIAINFLMLYFEMWFLYLILSMNLFAFLFQELKPSYAGSFGLSWVWLLDSLYSFCWQLQIVCVS